MVGEGGSCRGSPTPASAGSTNTPPISWPARRDTSLEQATTNSARNTLALPLDTLHATARCGYDSHSRKGYQGTSASSDRRQHVISAAVVVIRVTQSVRHGNDGSATSCSREQGCAHLGSFSEQPATGSHQRAQGSELQ
jgi:hypothetical protein